jgi:hypothetical protein
VSGRDLRGASDGGGKRRSGIAIRGRDLPRLNVEQLSCRPRFRRKIPIANGASLQSLSLLKMEALISPPIAISNQGALSSSSLPEPLRELVTFRIKADSALNHPALELELAEATYGPRSALVRELLQATADQALVWKSKVAASGRKLSPEEEARGEFVHAWALGRIGEYDGTTPGELPARLEASLERFRAAGELLKIPEPPLLEGVPSVTRPREHLLPLVLPEVPAWVGEMLAEWARTQTTLAFSKLLSDDTVIGEEKLADLLDMACRRNVQGPLLSLFSMSSYSPLYNSAIHSH